MNSIVIQKESECTGGEEMSVIDAPDVNVPLAFVVPDSWDAYLAKDDGAVRWMARRSVLPLHEIERERPRTSRAAAHLNEVVCDREVNELLVSDPGSTRPHPGLVLFPNTRRRKRSAEEVGGFRLDRRDPERTMSQS